MADDTTEFATAQFNALIARLTDKARREGFVEGRVFERSQLGVFFEMYDETHPLRPEDSEDSGKRRFAAGVLSEIVKNAVSSLAPTNPQGADLGAIEQWLRDQGHDVDSQQVRSGLRQLTTNGTVRRVSRGRYLPAATVAEAAPNTDAYAAEIEAVAAEAAE